MTQEWKQLAWLAVLVEALLAAIVVATYFGIQWSLADWMIR